MGGIFISYRRDDSQAWAGRLYDALRRTFGPSRVFRDIDTLEAGADYAEAIEQWLAKSDVVLVVIGPRWLTATDPNGRRRLDDPDDLTRLEVAAALRRGIRVVPVLVGGAAMPSGEELPEDASRPRPAARPRDQRSPSGLRSGAVDGTAQKVPEARSQSQIPPAELASFGSRIVSWRDRCSVDL